MRLIGIGEMYTFLMLDIHSTALIVIDDEVDSDTVPSRELAPGTER